MKMKTGDWVRILVSAAALAFIVWFLRDKLDDAFHILRSDVSLPHFSAAAAAYGISILFLTGRMRMILRAKEIVFGYMQALYFSMLGLFFSIFLPSAIGGDIVKGVYLNKYAKNKADIFSCLVMDRFAGFCIVLGLAFGSSAVLNESWNPVPKWASYGALGAGISCAVLLLIKPEWFPAFFSKLRFLPHSLQEKLNSFYDSLAGFFHNRPLVIKSWLYSLAAQLLFIAAYYFIGQSLDAPIPFSRFIILVPMMTIISMAPSINGLGVREAGSLFLLKMYMPPERALAMTVLIAVLIYAYAILGGIWYFLYSLSGAARRQDS